MLLPLHRCASESSRGKYPVRTAPCPDPDIRSDVNSSRICSITFPTQSRYAFADLTRWMRPGERRTRGKLRCIPPEQVGRTIKSEKDVFRSEIVCWLSTSSLTSQRGRRAAKRQRGRQVRASHAPAHLRAKILLTANTSTEHNRIHPTQRTTGLREYFRVHRHKYEKYPGFYPPSTLRPPARTNISYNRCPTMSRWQRGFSHSKFLPLFLDEGVRKLC